MKKIIGNVGFLYSFLRLTKDPNRLDLVFALADGLDAESDPKVRAMLDLPAVRRALAGRLPVPRIDLVKLRALPEGTFGRAAARFFDEHGFDPEGLYHTKG